VKALRVIDLKRLNHLVALAEECHFARAAQRVNLSQPAFSRSIQALERELGQRLFDRDAGEVRPTPAGVFLIERARQLLFNARCLQRDAALYNQGDLGDASFGAGPFPAATLLPEVLPELRRRHPQLRLRVEVSAWAHLLEHLRAERIEFFVAEVRSLPADAALDIQPIGRQKGAFFVRAGHPLADGFCTLVQAWSYGVATTQLPVVLKTALGALLGLPPGQEPSLALACDDLLQLRTLALQTDTVIGATHVSMRDDVRAGRLLPLKLQGMPPLYSEMGVVSLTNRSPSPAARLAIRMIGEVATRIEIEQAAWA
jgi:DNA-binding transcriptional LysR family regulator